MQCPLAISDLSGPLSPLILNRVKSTSAQLTSTQYCCDIKATLDNLSWPMVILNPNLRGGGAIIIHHRRIAFFSATEHRMNPGLVCKFKFCRCGPVEKNQSALSVSV